MLKSHHQPLELVFSGLTHIPYVQANTPKYSNQVTITLQTSQS